MRKIEVSYLLNEEQEQRLKEITKKYESLNLRLTDEKMFEYIMLLGSDSAIQNRLHFHECKLGIGNDTTSKIWKKTKMGESATMKYINIDECLAQIDEARINRNNHANVYLCRTSTEVILQFAYSQDKQDHIVLKQASIPSDGKAYEEIWIEYLAVSMFIEHSYRVHRFVDDVRGRRGYV